MEDAHAAILDLQTEVDGVQRLTGRLRPASAGPRLAPRAPRHRGAVTVPPEKRSFAVSRR